VTTSTSASHLALLAGSAVLALSVVVLPWYELDDYVTNGWDASWLARGALLLALVNIVLARTGGSAPVAAGVATTALALVAVRVAFPPDFGFDFDGLDVPVERRFGCWLALGAAAVACAAAALEARGRSLAIKSQTTSANA
jgi:hypothetical protein